MGARAAREGLLARAVRLEAGGTAGAGGSAGTGVAAGAGGTGGTPPCSSGTVTFEHTSFSAAPDCIVPGVCIKRGRVKGIYNSS
jgi:hypothetical protein